MNRYTNTAAISIALIFLAISTLHVYWALGGLYWYEEVLPTNSLGTKRLDPGMASGLIVSFGLLIMAFIIAGTQGWFDKYLNRKYLRYSTLVISLIFLLRAIGDFKFIGLFKTIEHTRFGVNDTIFFFPLCLLISLITFFIFISTREKR